MHSTFHFGGALSRVLLTGSETDGELAVLLHDQPPGNATPPHRHRTDSEIPVVLSGALTVEADGRVSTIAPGMARWLAPMRTHRLSNRGDSIARFVLICVPAAFERFVEAVGSPAQPGDAPRPVLPSDRARMIAAAPHYGIELQPPSRLLEAESHVVSVDLPRETQGPGFAFEPLAATGNDDDALCVVHVMLRSLGSLHLVSIDPQTLIAIDGPVDAEWAGTTRRLSCGETLHARASSSLTISSSLDRMIRMLWITTLRAVRRFSEAKRTIDAGVTVGRA